MVKLGAEDKILVEDLNLYYGKFHALKDVNLRLPANSITALVGPSGCGKSSLLRAINRMNDDIPGVRMSGKVEIDGENICNRKIDVVHLRKRVGMVFQKPNPFPRSIYDNVSYGPRIHGVKRRDELDAIVEESLRGAALWNEVKDRLDQPAFGLSEGQQQRLCIARQIAVQPEVLLMDEPTSGLDPISTLKIEELIRDLARKYTIVIVTHNMQQAARVSERCALLLDGEIAEFDDTDIIFTCPKDRRTEDYITGRFS